MDSRISRSIEAMERVMRGRGAPLWLFIDKESGCIVTTEDKKRASPMYEIADWVQFLTNHPHSRHPADDLRRLHTTFQKIWEEYISELTVQR